THPRRRERGSPCKELALVDFHQARALDAALASFRRQQRGYAMSYRTILVQTEDSVPGRMQVKAALDLAKRFGATLTGVYLKAEQIPAMFVGDAFSAVTLAESFLKERGELISAASQKART